MCGNIRLLNTTPVPADIMCVSGVVSFHLTGTKNKGTLALWSYRYKLSVVKKEAKDKSH